VILLLLFCLQQEAVESQLALPEGGEDVDIDAAGVTIRYNSKEVTSKRIAAVKPGDTIMLESASLKLTVKVVKAADERRLRIRELDKRVEITWSAYSEKEWVKDVPAGYEVAIDKMAIRVNGHEVRCMVGSFKGRSGVCVAAKKDFAVDEPWLRAAKLHYQAMMSKDEAVWKSSLSPERVGASSIPFWWSAGRAMVDKHGVKYVFDSVDDKSCTPKHKKLFFKRIQPDGQQRGMPVPIELDLEGDKWMVSQASY
jgi:ribosomal 50S subunit-recycling heat shock protein